MKRRRLCVHIKITVSQKIAAGDEVKIIEFHKFVISTRNKFNFEINEIANMDEVHLTFDDPSNQTVDSKRHQINSNQNNRSRKNLLYCNFNLLHK